MTTSPSIKNLDEEMPKLIEIAKLFDIQLETDANGNNVIAILDTKGIRKVLVPAHKLKKRLVAEICSKTVKWICYTIGKDCARVLLSQSDAKLKKISAAYIKWKEEGFPS